MLIKSIKPFLIEQPPSAIYFKLLIWCPPTLLYPKNAASNRQSLTDLHNTPSTYPIRKALPISTANKILQVCCKPVTIYQRCQLLLHYFALVSRHQSHAVAHPFVKVRPIKKNIHMFIHSSALSYTIISYFRTYKLCGTRPNRKTVAY